MYHRVKAFVGAGPLSMMVAGLFFAAMAALVKEVSREIPLFQVTFFRAAVSALVIGVAMGVRRIPIRGENQKLLLIRGLAGFIAMALNFYALSRIALGDAALLNQSSPVFVMLLSWFFLGERFHGPLLALTLLSFSGITLILRPTGELFNLAGLAALMSAIFAAGAYVSIRRLHQTDSFWTMAFYFMATAAILSFPFMILNWHTPTLRQWLMLLFSGLFGTLGQLLMTFAYKHDEASWVAPFAYAGVLFSFILGMIFFQEVPDLFTLVGGGLTVASGVGILRFKKAVRIPFSAVIPPSPEK